MVQAQDTQNMLTVPMETCNQQVLHWRVPHKACFVMKSTIIGARAVLTANRTLRDSVKSCECKGAVEGNGFVDVKA